MKQDGSGTLALTLNLSQSKDQVDKILTQDSILGRKIPSKDEITRRLTELKNQLEKNNGISNVTVTHDFQTLIVKLTCNFSDVKALNTAILQIWKTYDKHAEVNMTFVSYANSVFSRKFDHTLTGIKTGSLPANVKEVLEKGDYLLVYKFEKEVQSSRNPTAKVVPSGKAVILKTKALSVIQGTTKIDNDIKLK